MGFERDCPLDVIPARHSLEGPPAPEDGKIIEVDMEHVEDDRGETHKKQCQQCREPVLMTEPHPKARLRIEKSVGPTFPRPVFCDRNCWSEWASNTEV